MGKRQFYFGLTVTVAWLATMAGLIYYSGQHPNKMTPNEWGDFFAGVFAPLAFLWLVLGYMQQGEELRLSTEALRLQADELRNSVEQQRELVVVSRQQVEAEREALAYERYLREQEAKPSLSIIGAGGSFRGDGYCKYSFVISNSGNAATELLVDFFPMEGASKRLLDVPLFERGKQQSLTLEMEAPLEGDGSRLLISFKDVLGKQYELTYSVYRKIDSAHSPLSFGKEDAHLGSHNNIDVEDEPHA